MTFDLSKCPRDPATGFFLAQTRDGRKVRIYATDKADEIHGAIYNNIGGWAVCWWKANGKIPYQDSASGSDLQNLPERFEREVWVNVYDTGLVCSHMTRESADNDPLLRERRIACVRVRIEGNVGDGLS